MHFFRSVATHLLTSQHAFHARSPDLTRPTHSRVPSMGAGSADPGWAAPCPLWAALYWLWSPLCCCWPADQVQNRQRTSLGRWPLPSPQSQVRRDRTGHHARSAFFSSRQGSLAPYRRRLGRTSPSPCCRRWSQPAGQTDARWSRNHWDHTGASETSCLLKMGLSPRATASSYLYQCDRKSCQASMLGTRGLKNASYVPGPACTGLWWTATSKSSSASARPTTSHTNQRPSCHSSCHPELGRS